MSAPVGLRPAAGSGERGVALVMALLVMMVISVIAMILMSSLNTDTKVAGHTVRMSQALNIAEAGVGEALARIKSGDVPDNGEPNMVAQVFLVPAGSVPVLGADSIGLATEQPAGEWLAYSTANRGKDALTVRYKTTPDGSAIYRYDPAVMPPVQTASGVPIFEVTSTGQVGKNRRTIVTEVYAQPILANVYAALAANVGISFTGSSVVCGYNHRADTPDGTGKHGRILLPPCLLWETGLNNIPAAWTPMGISVAGASLQFGTPPILPGQSAPFYDGPWATLGISQSDFYAWIGSSQGTMPSDLKGIFYLDSDGVSQNRTSSFVISGGNGEGLLYVDGDLTINGTFNYRGMIYVEGNLAVNGTSWILGSVVVRGNSQVVIASGSSTILYSSDGITQSIAKYGGQFTTLSWRETN